MDEREETIGGPAQILERQGMPRCAVDEAAMLLLLGSGASIQCQLVELGLDGCRLKVWRKVPAENRVNAEVSFKMRGIAFRLSGTAEWPVNGNVVDVSFGPMSSRRRDDLVEVLCEQEAENAGKVEHQSIDAKASGELGLAADPAEVSESVSALEPQTPRRRLRLLNFVRPRAHTRKTLVEEDARQRDVSPGAVQSSLAAGAGPILVPEIATPEAPALNEPAPLESAKKTVEQPAATGRERRGSRRCDVDTSAIIHLIKIGSKLPGQILDLSLGGCRLRTAERFSVGIYTRVEVEFRLQGLPVLLGGVIQAVHDRNHIGIRFLDVSARKRVQLTELIEEIQELEAEKN